MPQLVDLLGKVSINHNVYKNGKGTLNRLSTLFPREELTFANRLRTSFETNTGKKINYESDKIFAGWCDELNRTPKTDCFQLGKINTVKQPDETRAVQELEREIHLREWLQGVEERDRILRAKSYNI